MNTSYKGIIAYDEPILVDDLVGLYRDIFGSEPWNEGYLCPSTGQKYPLSFGSRACTCCEDPRYLRDFYPQESLRSEFRRIYKKQGYRETIATLLRERNPRTVCASGCDQYSKTPKGFMWGWQSDISSLNQEKLQLSVEQTEECSNSIKREIPDFNMDNFYYFAEIGVDESMRGCGIAGELYRKQTSIVLNGGIRDILVRTTRSTNMPYEWFLRMGYIPVFEYGDELDRVILVKQLG